MKKSGHSIGNDQPRPTARREKVVAITVGALALVLAMVLAVTLYQRWNSQGAYRSEYEGRVTDKWVTYHETQTGTGISRHLLIKSKNDDVFQVVVSPELYEEAKVNTWVIKNKAGVKVLPAEP